MTQETVKGVIVFDANTKSYALVGYLTASDFEVGGWAMENHSNYVLVREVILPLDLPENFDTVTSQLKSLDAKEKELKIQYHQALEHIKVQRNNLLAIEWKENK